MDVKVPPCYITHTVPSYCCSWWSHSASPVSMSSERNLLVIKLLHDIKFNNTTPLFLSKTSVQTLTNLQGADDDGQMEWFCKSHMYNNEINAYKLQMASYLYQHYILPAPTCFWHIIRTQLQFLYLMLRWPHIFHMLILHSKSLSYMLHACSPNSLQLWSPPKATRFPPVLCSVNVLIRSKSI